MKCARKCFMPRLRMVETDKTTLRPLSGAWFGSCFPTSTVFSEWRWYWTQRSCVSLGCALVKFVNFMNPIRFTWTPKVCREITGNQLNLCSPCCIATTEGIVFHMFFVFLACLDTASDFCMHCICCMVNCEWRLQTLAMVLRFMSPERC